MTSFVGHCKNVKTLVTPDATIGVHHVSADPIKDPFQQSNSIRIPEMVQNTKQEPPLINAGSLRCRTCLDIITTQKCYFLMIMGHLTKTIKEMIIFCVPQMATTLSDDDVVCYKCLEAIEFCVKFIESCLEVEEKIQNLENKEITIDQDYFMDNYTFDAVSIDHDYVIKIEPDDAEPSEDLDVQISSLMNHQSPKSNPDESGISILPNLEPHSALKSGEFQENSQLEEVLQTVARDCFKCGYCSKTCKTENLLLDHMRRMHKTIQQPTEENDVVSQISVENPSSSDGKTISNNKSNSNKRPYKKPGRTERYQVDPIIKCPFCVEKLRLGQMEAHLRLHNQGQIPKVKQSKEGRTYKKRLLKCKTCSERFSSRDEFKFHLQMHPPYVCDQCGKTYVLTDSFIAHKSTHNDPNAFICEFCGKGYRERNLLNVHLKLHENKKFKCEQCPKIFNTKLHLKNHVCRVHTSIDVGQCSQCGRIFKNRSSLKSHVRLVHLKLKPFKCEVCEKQFGRADYLRLHKKMHEREPGRKKPFRSGRKSRWKIMFPDSVTSSELLPCKFCGKRFLGVPKLKMHLETHVRRYPCQFCPLTFARKQYRQRHELLHNNGSKNFIRCNICWKRMETEEELEEHVETKHNQLKYTCHVCGQMFHKIFLLNQHSLREHNNSSANAETLDQIIIESLLEVTGSNET